MNLYNLEKIDAEIEAMFHEAEMAAAEGVPYDETDKLALLCDVAEDLRMQTIEDFCKLRSNHMGTISAIDAEIERLKKQKENANKKIDWAVKVIGILYDKVGEKKIQAGTYTISSMKSKRLELDEGIFNDERFQTIEEVRKIDKVGIKKALSSGEEIAGATLTEHDNLQIK